MKKITFMIFAISFALAIFSPSAGDYKDAFLLLAETKPGSLSQSQRIPIADDLLRKMRELNAYIPSLTDSESKWLEKEWNSLKSLPIEASSRKALSLTMSWQYQTKEIKGLLERICSALEGIKAQSGVSIKKEMFCWASAGYDLTDNGQFNDSLRILEKFGKISLPSKVREQLGLAPGEDMWLGFNFCGRRIQNKIVLPYLGKTSFE